MSIGDDFLLACKRNYFEKITPSNKQNTINEGYIRLVKIATEYFNRDAYVEFSGFFQEGQYFVALWAAHLMLEYGNPNPDLIGVALRIIESYSDNPLAKDVSEEERQWLEVNRSNFIR